MTLIVFDIIEFLKNWKYTIKYKVKIVLSIVIFTIFLSLIIIGFKMLGFLWIEISVVINIAFSIIFFIKFIFLQLIKDKKNVTIQPETGGKNRKFYAFSGQNRRNSTKFS